jgi:hypothetical protein
VRTVFAAAFALFGGCETLRFAPTDEIARLPVYNVNEAPAVNRDYITHYPAGRLFAIELIAQGSMFTQQAHTPLLVSLSRDLYVYKQWASFDGKNWTNAHKLFDMRVDGKLAAPGGSVVFTLHAR